MGFREAMDFVLVNEGGYSNDRDDVGGETNYGIASNYNKGADVKKLTESDAVDIYRRDYWEPYRADDMPHDVGAKYFDVLVNAGPRDAGRVLQKAINRAGGKVGIDGIVGSRTVGALYDLDEDEILNAMVLEQKNMYYDKIKKRPKNSKYLKGWMRRAEKKPSTGKRSKHAGT
jgi:lysozyme family protein